MDWSDMLSAAWHMVLGMEQEWKCLMGDSDAQQNTAMDGVMGLPKSVMLNLTLHLYGPKGHLNTLE